MALIPSVIEKELSSSRVLSDARTKTVPYANIINVVRTVVQFVINANCVCPLDCRIIHKGTAQGEWIIVDTQPGKVILCYAVAKERLVLRHRLVADAPRRHQQREQKGS